jgi:hypothetical protein
MAKKTYEKDYVTTEVNADPITGEPGSHPVGTGLGAAGAGAAGAAVGLAVGGPIGGLLGGVIGAVAGGAAGHAVAEAYDPTGEDVYWRENYRNRDYVADEPYEAYRPAYAYGWTARRHNLDRSWPEVEPKLEREWEAAKDRVEIGWDRAKHAAKDAWQRVDDSFSGWFGEEDDYWRANFRSRDYVGPKDDYEMLRPAYRYGWESRVRTGGGRWEDAEADLQRGWNQSKYNAELSWDRAKHAVRDAWHRVERRLPGDFDRDGR